MHANMIRVDCRVVDFFWVFHFFFSVCIFVGGFFSFFFSFLLSFKNLKS